MFGGSASNPYDDIVAKTTDENLTSENWELIINLCDKVTDEGDEGAHNVIAALLKRLAHRNPNVQLYTLSLTDALSKNCGVAVNKEIASRAFTQGLEKLVTDRTTHDKVRKRALVLVAQWTGEFEDDPSLGVMEDCYNNLKSKGYKFETPQEPLPPTVDDEIRRKEEEELQRVLEMSMQDRGGRGQWAQYSLASGASSSSSAAVGSSSRPGAGSIASGGGSSGYAAPKYQGGYAPARSPSPQRPPQQTQHQPSPSQQPPTQPQSTQHHSPQTPAQEHFTNYSHSNTSNVSTNSIPPAFTAATTAMETSQAGASTIVTRVRALHTFKPTESGELAFEKGDIIKVVDRGYKDWWRGQLKGRTGIFPVNYVEPMPEPTASELAREAEQEAAVFGQAVNVEKLLSLLRTFDPAKDNLADNEEIQELYRSSMALRPKIVKLIDKYSQKRADLVSMNETFVRARTIFDRMMEESLARHTGVYDQPTYRPPYARNPSPVPIRPDSRTGGRGRHDYPLSPGTTAPGYPGYGQAGPIGVPQAFPEPQPAPTVIGYHPAPAGFPAAAESVPYDYGSPPGHVQSQPLQQPIQAVQPQPQPVQPLQLRQQQNQPQPQPQQQPQPAQQQPQVAQQSGYVQMANAPYTAQGPTPYPASTPTQQQQPQDQSQVQPQYGQVPYQTQPQSQPQTQGQTSPQMSFQGQPQPSQQHAQPAIQQQHAQQPQAAQVPLQSQHANLYTQPQTLSQPQHQEPHPQLQPIQTLTVEQLQPVQQPAQQAQPAEQSQPTQQPVQQAQAQPVQQQQHQHQPSVQSGPPYVFDPKATYSDPNVQAWAQYYAQGGTDLAGSVYFVSVPRLTDGAAASQVTAQGGVVGQDGNPGQNASQSGSGVQQGYDYGGPQQQTVDSTTHGVQSPGSYFDASSTTAQQPTNTSSTSLGLTSHHNLSATLGASSPGGGAATAHGPSPTVTSTTPSWVLPKKDTSGSPGIGGVQGLTGRFAGVSLMDPGSASA